MIMIVEIILVYLTIVEGVKGEEEVGSPHHTDTNQPVNLIFV